MAGIPDRKFSGNPRKRPYSIHPRPMDLDALEASAKIRPDLTRQVRVSSGMTLIDTRLMKAVRGFWYV